MKSEIRFADIQLKETLKKLKDSKTEDKKLYEWICRALKDIEENAFCGRQISKRLIPKEYIKKYKLDNLWKYDLPSGWRLIYTVGMEGAFVLSIVLEWFNHKDYNKRFRYLF